MRRIGMVAVATAVVVATSHGAFAQEAAPTPTDAEIAAIVVAANLVDAEMGEFAASRATDVRVKEFAGTMTRDHRAVIEQATALVTRLGVTPAENAISRGLVTQSAAARERLAQERGRAFDRAYMAHEVTYHEAVIAAVDEVLLPNARHPELKQAIEAVRPALVAHLEHARRLRDALR